VSLFKHSKGVPANATVVSATFVEDKGIDRALYEFVLDVVAPDGSQVRATVRQKALTDQHPAIGDHVTVHYKESDRSAEIDLDGDPRYRPQDVKEAQAFNERCSANFDEIHHLESVGTKAPATLTEVTECGWMRSLGQREFAVAATVEPPGAAPFVARFSIFDTTSEGLDTPTVGQHIAVLFDPADPALVRAPALWDSPILVLGFDGDRDDSTRSPVAATPAPRWKVPPECPTCGAPVDQSVESFAEHPQCHMCKNPLPCDPAS
jgi:hypothetical protein